MVMMQYAAVEFSSENFEVVSTSTLRVMTLLCLWICAGYFECGVLLKITVVMLSTCTLLCQCLLTVEFKLNISDI